MTLEGLCKIRLKVKKMMFSSLFLGDKTQHFFFSESWLGAYTKIWQIE
jgi:hypothetical protein